MNNKTNEEILNLIQIFEFFLKANNLNKVESTLLMMSTMATWAIEQKLDYNSFKKMILDFLNSAEETWPENLNAK